MRDLHRYRVEDLKTGKVWESITGKQMLFITSRRYLASADNLFNIPGNDIQVLEGRWKVNKLKPEPKLMNSCPDFVREFREKWRNMQRRFGVEPSEDDSF